MARPEMPVEEWAKIYATVNELMCGPLGAMWLATHHPTRGREVAMAAIWLQNRLQEMGAPEIDVDSCQTTMGFHCGGLIEVCPWDLAQKILQRYRFEQSHKDN